MVKCSQINLTPPISLVNMLYWLSVALINLTLPFLACLSLGFNSFIKAPTSHIRSILLRSLDVPGGSGQSYTATQSNLGLGMFIFNQFTYLSYVSKFMSFYVNNPQV